VHETASTGNMKHVMCDTRLTSCIYSIYMPTGTTLWHMCNRLHNTTRT